MSRLLLWQCMLSGTLHEVQMPALMRKRCWQERPTWPTWAACASWCWTRRTAWCRRATSRCRPLGRSCWHCPAAAADSPSCRSPSCQAKLPVCQQPLCGAGEQGVAVHCRTWPPFWSRSRTTGRSLERSRSSCRASSHTSASRRSSSQPRSRCQLACASAWPKVLLLCSGRRSDCVGCARHP